VIQDEVAKMLYFERRRKDQVSIAPGQRFDTRVLKHRKFVAQSCDQLLQTWNRHAKVDTTQVITVQA